MSDNDKPVKDAPLTGAEQIELEKLRAETAAHQKRTAELEKENRDLTVKTTIERGIASAGVKSHLSDKDLYKLLSSQEGVTITPSGDGSTLHCERDGKNAEFKELVESFAVKHQHMFDGRTLRHLIDNTDAVKSLADLPTREDRMRYIDKRGLDAFERLGQYHPKTLDVAKLNANDWKALSISEKTQIVEQHGSEIVSNILRRGVKQ